MSAEHRRLALAFGISLLVHALLLSLTFGGQGLGLPGFGLPWQERRAEVPELRIVLVPAPVSAAKPEGPPVQVPLQPASTGQPVAGGLVLTPPESPAFPAPTPDRTAAATVPEAGPTARVEPVAAAPPAPDTAIAAAPAKPARRAEGPADTAPPSIPGPAVIATEQPDDAAPVVPAAASAPAPVVAAAPGASNPRAVTLAPGDADAAAQERVDAAARERALDLVRLDRSQREARQQAVQQEAARLALERQEAQRAETARLEAERQEAARQEAQRAETVRLDAERQAAARQAAARLEADRQEAQRTEAARQDAARQEVQRAETARLEAERQEAVRQAAARQEAARHDAQRAETARLEAERQEAVRQAAARQEAARQEAARQAAARVEAAQEAEARREATLRAIGRQLDEEAARREAASTAAGQPSRLAPSSSGMRRGRLFGRTDPNAELILYAEAWARKIQLNLTFDMVRDAAKRPHTDPLVTVAIRSDGSVESVTFVLSSGVADIDEAIRRIVQSQMPYPAFPPGLAREFDVVEIRRTWHFDMAIRLY